jgi:hypothetical protein
MVLGRGAEATRTLLKGSEEPEPVVTVTVRLPVAAVMSTVPLMFRVVVFVALEMTAVTPLPLNETPVAPVRLSPEIVAENIVPCVTYVGVIAVMRIGFPVWTVKPLNRSDVPFGVVTLTPRRPLAAPGATVRLTGNTVAVPPAEMVAVTPVPVKFTALAPKRFAPTMVAATVVPVRARPGSSPVI